MAKIRIRSGQPTVRRDGSVAFAPDESTAIGGTGAVPDADTGSGAETGGAAPGAATGEEAQADTLGIEAPVILSYGQDDDDDQAPDQAPAARAPGRPRGSRRLGARAGKKARTPAQLASDERSRERSRARASEHPVERGVPVKMDQETVRLLLMLAEGMLVPTLGERARFATTERLLIEPPLTRIVKRLTPDAAAKFGALADPLILGTGLLLWALRVFSAPRSDATERAGDGRGNATPHQQPTPITPQPPAAAPTAATNGTGAASADPTLHALWRTADG